MKRFLVTALLGLTVAAVTVAAAVAGDFYSPRLSKAATRQSGVQVRIVLHHYNEMTGGEADRERSLVLLADDVGRTLLRAPRITDQGRDTDTGEAVFILAHEMGHILDARSQDDGMQESRADCYAARNWKGYALAVGFRKAQLPRIARLIRVNQLGCWH